MKHFSTISNLLVKSPIYLLQKNMHTSYEAASLLIVFFEHVLNQEWDKVIQIRQQITDCESRGDQYKMKLRSTLHKDVLSSFARSDLIDLMIIQDSIANQVKDISGIVVGRTMTIPKALHPLWMRYLKSAVQTCEQAHQLIDEFVSASNALFSKKIATKAQKTIKKLSELESQTDAIEIEVRYQLYQLEPTIQSTIHIMFLYRLIEMIGSLADRAEDIGDLALLLMAK